MKEINTIHSVGKTIAKLRKEKGWTQVELAGKLNISDKAVSKWESEAGQPEISQLPILAKIFNVSIDYIMTGKEVEEKIINMSKLELCAKNNDINLLSTINILSKDEDGLNIIDYAKKYNNYNVIAWIIRNKDLDTFCSLCKIDWKNPPTVQQAGEVLYYAILTNTVDVFSEKLNTSFGKFLQPPSQNVLQMMLDGIKEKDLKEGKFPEIFELLSTEGIVEEKTYELLFSKWKEPIYYEKNFYGTKIYNLYNEGGVYSKIIWVLGLQTLMFYLVKNNNMKLLTKYFEFIKSINAESFKEREQFKNSGRTYNGYGVSNAIANPYITFSLECIQILFDRKEIEIAKEINSFNKMYEGKALSDYEVNLLEKKADKNSTEEDVVVASCVENGVVIIDKLIECKDVQLVKKIIENNPIHIYELLVKWEEDKDYRSLFKFGVDNNLKRLCDSIIIDDGSTAKIVAQLVCSEEPKTITESNKLYVSNHNWFKKFSQHTVNGKYCPRSIKNFIDDMAKVREEIITKATFEANKKITCEGLTKEYFTKQVKEGNTELAIIKLCVKLEAILKYDYRYEGTFEEILNEFCKKELTFKEDDGWGYMEWKESSMIPLLHKLRKHRNGIVHSTAVEDTISLEEFNNCVEYIFSLDKD